MCCSRFNEFEYSFDEGATSPNGGHIPGTPAGGMTPAGAGGMTPGYDSNHHAAGSLDPARTPGGNFSPFSSHHGAATPAGMSSFRGRARKNLLQVYLLYGIDIGT